MAGENAAGKAGPDGGAAVADVAMNAKPQTTADEIMGGLEKGFEKLAQGSTEGSNGNPDPEKKPGDEGDGKPEGDDKPEEGEKPEAGKEKPDGEKKPEEQAPELMEKDELKGLPEETRKRINEKFSKRVAKYAGRAKDAEEAAQAAKSTAETAETEKQAAVKRADEAEQKLSDAAFSAAIGQGVHPDYVTKDQAEILKKDDELGRFEAWLDEHVDGFKPANGEGREYTAQEVRQRLRQVREERKPILAKAERIREEAIALQRADMLEGRKSRLGKAGDTKKPEKAPEAKKEPEQPKKKPDEPEKVPPAGGSGNRPVVSGGRKADASLSREEFEQDGGTPDALEKQMERAFEARGRR